MKLLYERLVDMECQQLSQLGIEPNVSALSERVKALSEGHDLVASVESWNYRNNPQLYLQSSDLSKDIIRAFAEPITK